MMVGRISDVAKASLLNIDTGTTRKALAVFAKLSKSYLAGKGHSLNISQNHVGQLLEDFELDRLALDKLAHARRLPIDAQLAKLKQIVNEHPGSTAAAIRTTIALRQAGYFSCSESTNETSSYSAIPKHIVQYWDHEPSPDIRDLMASWQSMNSGYHWQCFDNQQAIGFLDQNFPPSVLKAYRRATQPAQKADIFRLAYLTARGGIYADADDRCDAMLGGTLGSDKTFVAHQDNFGSIGNNFIAACPEHPVLRRALFLAVEAVNRGDQDLIWLCTGPGLLTRAFAGMGKRRGAVLVEAGSGPQSRRIAAFRRGPLSRAVQADEQALEPGFFRSTKTISYSPRIRNFGSQEHILRQLRYPLCQANQKKDLP